MRIFHELGRSIEDAWQAIDYDERALPELAATALARGRLHREVSGEDVLRWLLMTAEIPPQDDIDASFGDPPITVYSGRRFYIQVILWLQGSTAVHRHGFSGAFMVLDGSSLHSTYAFTRRRRVSSRLLVGDVELRDVELLSRGAVVPITNDLTHSLFHLDVPSATIVVRTYHEDEASPQYNYMPPSVATDPFYREAHTTRLLQGLTFAQRGGHLNYEALAAEVVGRCDLHTAFRVMEQAYDLLGSAARAAPIARAAVKRHGAIVGDLIAALDEDLRRRAIARLRARTEASDLRYFLALVQNLPDRDAIDAMIRRRFPKGRPRDRIEGWARRLSGAATVGVDFSDDVTALACSALLDGRSNEEALERLKGAFDPADVDARRDALLRHIERIRQTALAPLFRWRRKPSRGAR
jgi:hypothetical protein